MNRRLPLFATAAVGLLALIPLGTAADQDQSFQQDPTTGAFSLHWTGQSGRTYIVETSQDLIHWGYYPEFVSGAGAPIAYGITIDGPADRFFVRLRFTDDAGSLTSGDFDHDGVSNADELVRKTNPFLVDTDGDGMPDGWELRFHLDPLDPNDAGLDSDGDGMSNLAEFLAGREPNTVADRGSMPAGCDLVVTLPGGGFLGLNTSSWTTGVAPPP